MANLLARVHGLRHTNGWIFGTMLFSACLSLTASFVLSIDAVRLAADPAAIVVVIWLLALVLAVVTKYGNTLLV